MTQSPALTTFYRLLHDWIEGGCNKDHAFFVHDAGLCHNLWRFYSKNQDTLPNTNYRGLSDELLEQFSKAGLNYWMPFNSFLSTYEEEKIKKTIFSNPNRIQWVKDHVHVAVS